MTTATPSPVRDTTRPRAAPRRTDTASRWAGVAGLYRLFLRLDRVRILVWTLALALTMWATVASLEVAYPDAGARQARAALMGNPSAVMMSGPAFGHEDYTLGAMVANEISLVLLVATALMAILLMIRHTRAEEESGRLETLRALPVHPSAPPAAALLAVATATAVVGGATAVVLVVLGLAVADSLAFGLAATLTGLVFAAVAAVAAQVTEHTRAASGLAMAVLGAAFLARGVGDIIEPTGSWVSWLSPIAWAQQTRLFVDLRWWPLLLSVALTVLLLVAAVALSRRRDLGAGLRPARPGPAEAAAGLRSVTGMARHLLRGPALGWGTGLFLFALAMGSLANSLEDALGDLPPELQEWLVSNPDAMTESFASVMLAILVIGIVAQAVGAVLRLRAEDDSGRAALLLVAGASRSRLFLGWVAVVVAHAVLLTLLTGLGMGLGVAVAIGSAGWVTTMVGAALAYLPAVLLIAAVAAVLVGWAPQWSALGWVLVLYSVVVVWFGPILRLPDWAMDLSPIELTPTVPADDLTATPLVVLGLGALLLGAVALAGFRRRDLLA